MSEFTTSLPFKAFFHLSVADVTDYWSRLRLIFACSLRFRRTHLGVVASFIWPLLVNACDFGPYLSMHHYLEVRGLAPVPLFVCADGSPLTAAQVYQCLRILLLRMGISGNFSSHSFRIGAATAYGFPNYLTQALGRWTSDAFRRYICTSPDLLTRAVTGL